MACTALQLRPLMLLACLLQACTHHYIAVSEAASRRDREALQKLNLQGAEFTVTCRWKPAYGKIEPANTLCLRLTRLLTYLNAKVEGAEDEDSAASEEEEEEEEASDAAPVEAEDAREARSRLTLEVELRSLPLKYSTLDHTLLWLTYGLFPASTDAWHSVDARVLDENGLVLQQGEFRALIRTWSGWGYWLANRAMEALKRQPHAEPYDEATSQDFYAFIAHVVYDAALSQQQTAQLKAAEGEAP